MENGSSVTVNGRWIVLPGLASSFSTILLLRPGANTIAVVVTDRAGNYNMSRSTVVFDTTPPWVEIIHPPDGLLTSKNSLTLKLLVEGGAVLSIGGRTFQMVPGGLFGKVPFNLTMNLSEGTNLITVRAQDAAGNVYSASRQVVLDTVAPRLSLSSPFDGFKTSNDSVFLVGQAEPGSIVMVQGAQVVVGFSGDFGAEIRLGAGNNRITVRAQDAAGNIAELEQNVTRTAGRHGDELVAEGGTDWMFWGFVALSAVVASGEGALLIPLLERRRKGAGKVG
jgi:bacillopeptidase F